MKKVNHLENFSFKTNFKNDDNNEENNRINEDDIRQEKVLCNHCGRTASNGIRCLGMCVEDNEY